MRFIIVPAAVCLFFAASSANAAKTECPSISAEAHHSSSSTGKATETDGRCTIAIDGANADSQGVPEEASRCAGTVFRNGAGPAIAQSREQLAYAMFFLLVPDFADSASSVDPQNPGFPLVSNVFEPSQCLQWFQSLEAMAPQDIQSSNLFDEIIDFNAGLVDEIASCIQNGSASFPVTCIPDGTGRVSIRFSTSFGAHNITMVSP